jgi:hypothetical protein
VPGGLHGDLGEAVALADHRPGHERRHPLDQRHRQGCRPAGETADAGQVGPGDPRDLQQRHEHRRRAPDAGHPVPDRVGDVGDRVEAVVQDDGAAGHHLPVEVADHPHRVEPGGQVDQPGGAQPGGVLGRAADLVEGHVTGLVEHRHGAGGEAGRLQHVGDHCPVRQLDALAHPGGAAGVGQVGEVGRRVDGGVAVGVGGVGGEEFAQRDHRHAEAGEVHRGGRVGDVLRTGDHDGLHRGPGERRAHRRQGGLPGDHGAGPGIAELVGQHGGRQQWVGGGEGGSRQQHAVVDGRVLQAVGQVDRDHVAPADAQLGEARGDGVGAPAQLGERQLDVVVDEGGVLAPAAHRGPQDRSDRHLGVVQ